MVYSTRRFVVCLSVCHFVLVLFCPFSIAITSLGEERANLSVFRTFVRFVLVWICRFPPLGVWEGLRFVIVALPGLSLTFFLFILNHLYKCLFVCLFIYFFLYLFNIYVCIYLFIYLLNQELNIKTPLITILIFRRAHLLANT